MGEVLLHAIVAIRAYHAVGLEAERVMASEDEGWRQHLEQGRRYEDLFGDDEIGASVEE